MDSQISTFRRCSNTYNRTSGNRIQLILSRIGKIASSHFFYHGSSTDTNPHHDYCPQGLDSWCFYDKAIALGRPPDSHSSHRLYLARYSVELRKEILKVYVDLTFQDLLKRCLKKIQNINESLHSKFWRKCLKMKHVVLLRVRHSALAMTLEHSFGTRQGSLLTDLGLLHEKSLHAC